MSSSPLTVPVEEGYERWAPSYDHVPNPLLAREERYLLPLLTDLRHKRILDLACGTGRWLALLTARGGGRGVGIDCSGAMLQVARNKCAIVGRLAQGACESLPFRAAVFELAVCSFALSHLPDLGCALRELARVLKPGAEVFVSDVHPEAYEHGWNVGSRDKDGAFHIAISPRSPEETAAAFLANGFECQTRAPLWLGKPEEPIFEQAGKSHYFQQACSLPAVLVTHFRRVESFEAP